MEILKGCRNAGAAIFLICLILLFLMFTGVHLPKVVLDFAALGAVISSVVTLFFEFLTHLFGRLGE